MKKVSSLLFLLFFLGSCTQAGMEQANLTKGMQVAQTTLASCQNPIFADDTFTPISETVYLDEPQSSTIEQMTNPKYATKNEAILIAQLADRLQPCDQNFISTLNALAPSVAAPIENYFQIREQGIVFLSEQKITWGQFITVLVKADSDSNEQSETALAQIHNQLDQENQIEQAQQTQALQAAADYWQRQQVINAANRPVSTNCSTFGNESHCTSY